MTSVKQTEEGKELSVGVVIFPGFQALDAFGPLDALNMLAYNKPLKLSIIAASLEPVSTDPPAEVFPMPGVVTFPVSNNFKEEIVPTHTFSDAPHLDLLLVPGGLGFASLEHTQPVVDFIARVFPALKYLLTICTGAELAARAGVLDNKRATITKIMFKMLTEKHPKVNWVTHARWVVDGKIWTTSGVTAGLDAILGWIQEVYGKDVADKLAIGMEFKRVEDSTFDEFADVHGL